MAALVKMLQRMEMCCLVPSMKQMIYRQYENNETISDSIPTTLNPYMESVGLVSFCSYCLELTLNC